MNSIVLIKQVPVSSQVGIDEETGVILRQAGEGKMNPYDLYALETALRIREEYGGEVTVLSMGPPQAEQVIREAFMMGADRGFLLSDAAFAGSDVLATSYALSQAIRRIGSYDLIISGKQTTDGDTAQVGAECSEFLSIPCMTNVRKIVSCDRSSVVVESDMGMTVEEVRIKLPCLLAVDKDIYQPRLPSYLKKKASAGREIEILRLFDLEDHAPGRYGLDGSPTHVVRIFPPSTEMEHQRWEGEGLGQRLYALLEEHKFLQEQV